MRSTPRAQRRSTRTSGSPRRRRALLTLAATSGVLAGGLAAESASAATPPSVGAVGFSPTGGGWEATTTGAVTAFGGASSYGSVTGSLNSPIVGMAATHDGKGYWLVASDGGVFTFGDAPFLGSEGGTHLNKPVVGISTTADGKGYWLVASDGGVFTFGDAPFLGSEGGTHLNKPVVGISTTADGKGYWLVASDGGVFTFGDAPFLGSEGGTHLNKPVVGISTTADGKGYWLVASDGGVFTFGDAPFLGSEGGDGGPTIIGLVPQPSLKGYTVIAANGAYFIFTPGHPVTSVPPPGVPSSTSVVGTEWPASLFSRPLSGNVQASSSGYTQDVVQDYEQNYGSVGVNEMPIWTVGANQPTVKVTVTPGCNDFTAGTGTQIPIPAAATTSGTGDSPLVVFQPSTQSDWELWQAKPAGSGTWTACWGGKISTATSDGVFPVPFGLSGSGISYLATAITEADIASGGINHVIPIQLPRCNAPQAAPANRTDCGSDPGQPSEGTWFRLPPTLAMPGGMTPYAQMVFRALQNYGAVVVDRAGAVMLEGENQADWSAQGHTGTDPITASWQGKPEYSVLSGIPWSDMQVVNP